MKSINYLLLFLSTCSYHHFITTSAKAAEKNPSKKNGLTEKYETIFDSSLKEQSKFTEKFTRALTLHLEAETEKLDSPTPPSLGKLHTRKTAQHKIAWCETSKKADYFSDSDLSDPDEKNETKQRFPIKEDKNDSEADSRPASRSIDEEN